MRQLNELKRGKRFESRVIVEKLCKCPASNGCKLSHPMHIRCVCQSALKINRAEILDPDYGSRTQFWVPLCDNSLCNRPPGLEDYERKLTLIAKYMRQLIDRQMTGRIK